MTRGSAISYSLSAVSAEDAERTDWLRTETLKGIESLDAGRYSSKSTEDIAAEGTRQVDNDCRD